MGRLINPLYSILSVFRQNHIQKILKTKFLQWFKFMGIGLYIREPPLEARDDGDDETVGLCGGSQGKPCSSGVHD